MSQRLTVRVTDEVRLFVEADYDYTSVKVQVIVGTTYCGRALVDLI